jgi:hypothetical protein
MDTVVGRYAGLLSSAFIEPAAISEFSLQIAKYPIEGAPLPQFQFLPLGSLDSITCLCAALKK